MAFNWRKIFYPVASDLFAPHTHMKALADSAIVPVPVANTTERASVFGAAGTVSAANPVVVVRADAAEGEELEYTVDPTGVDWKTVSGGKGWASYVPALTASVTSPTLGTGGEIRTGEYTVQGETVEGWATWQFGTSGMAAGSGDYALSLPVAASSSGTDRLIGTGWLFQGTWTPAVVLLASSTTVQLRPQGSSSRVGAAVPSAWAAAHALRVNFRYRRAA